MKKADYTSLTQDIFLFLSVPLGTWELERARTAEGRKADEWNKT